MEPARKFGMDESGVSDEAKDRINSARVRDLAFDLKRIAGSRAFDSEDLEQVARILLGLIDQGHRLEFEDLVHGLMAKGRSRHKAEELARAVFR